MGECKIYKEERDVLEKMRKIDECGMEKFGALDSSEKTISVLGDRWWTLTAKQEGGMINKKFPCNIWKNVMSAQMLEVPLAGVGTVLRLERDAWSRVKCCLLYTSPSPRDRQKSRMPSSA